MKEEVIWTKLPLPRCASNDCFIPCQYLLYKRAKQVLYTKC